MKKVRKLIIPAAGWGTRFLPMTKTVHKELAPILNKPAIMYLVEEALASGIEEVILVISDRKEEIEKFFDVNKELEAMLVRTKKDALLEITRKTNMDKGVIQIVSQDEQLGLAHALAQAAELVGDEPFAVILGDDLIRSKVPAIKQLIQAYEKTGSSILGVQTVSEENVNKYGIVEPKNSDEKDNELFVIKGAVEKPALKDAPSHKAILGRYVFTNEIMELFQGLKQVGSEEINVVDAFYELMKTQDIYAFEFEGIRYDLGSMEGFVKANIDYALENADIKQSVLEHISKLV